jgi:hypothetical protein
MSILLPAAAAALLFTCGAGTGEVDAHRGLWVGQATLTRVNEVSVPLDEDNVAIAPDPEVATPTADAAHIRLLLHVNGYGQVSLLKDVAILTRSSSSNGVLAAESDMALVTDEQLYGSTPPQPAVRLASAVFDFGDSRATDALDRLRDDAAQHAAGQINEPVTGSQADAEAAALAAAQDVVDSADVAAAFDTFLRDWLTSDMVSEIAEDSDPANHTHTLNARAAASNLLVSSFYEDSRGVDLVSNLVEAVSNAGTNTDDRLAAAHAMASAYADVTDNYHRFIAGKIFGDMIMDCASAGYTAVTNPAATELLVRSAVETAATDAFAEALRVKVARYDDDRGRDAVRAVVDAVVEAAMQAHAATGGVTSLVEDELEEAGRDAVAASVARYPVQADNPTPDYNAFVTSDDFLNCAADVAAAAAEGAVFERDDNPLFTAESVSNAALLAAANAMGALYEEAARAVRTSLPLEGAFGPGEGDPRLTWEIKHNDEADLGAAGLTGEIYLPARHPTNPFRHRRHPDHTAGFNIIRHIRIDFDPTPSNVLERVGFGVERITGVYREEIEGLHKPLGPDRDIGLKAEGTFVLNRISLIEALNAL